MSRFPILSVLVVIIMTFSLQMASAGKGEFEQPEKRIAPRKVLQNILKTVESLEKTVEKFVLVIDENKAKKEKCSATSPLPVVDAEEECLWFADYHKANEKAISEKKMLLIYFHDEKNGSPCKKFEADSLENDEVKKLFKDYVLLKLPMDAKIGEKPAASPANPIEQVGFVQKNIEPAPNSTRKSSDSSPFSVRNVSAETKLIQNQAFSEMLNTPGIAIIDYKNQEAEYYAQVVSVFPFLRNKPYNVFEMKTILTLPPGTVTQRSMVYAVRVHPEKPKSTNGAMSEMLEHEAESHSSYQARIRVQGHQNWDSRFQRITAKLPGGLWASEVCAESWPQQHLLESAIECVRCWRLSSGHWSAVVAEHPYYGYDMKRGSNGVWYATGIFGKQRPGYSNIRTR